jgi:endonuclease/exonuclease/phosphatase family metal-dependent hydrolase
VTDLLGDLNLDLDKQRDLSSNRVHLDVETYNYVGGLLQDAARGRGSTAEPDRRLDYVFVSPAATVEAAGPWKERRSGTMDHDPVGADLRLQVWIPSRLGKQGSAVTSHRG